MADMKIKRVLVAGPNGSLGESVVNNLVKNNFTVTLLTRNVDKTKEAFPECAVIEGNFDSVDKLAKIIKDNANSPQALVSLLNRDQLDAQITLMDAAIAAGIPHIVPSCFGGDTRHPAWRRLPIWKAKVGMEDYVFEKAEQGAFTFTGVQNGSFLDWALEKGVYLNVKGGPSLVYDGGDVPFSASLVDDVGRAVSRVLLQPEEFKNRMVFFHSAVITQNSLMKYAKELDPGREINVVPLDTGELESKAWERWNNGDHSFEVNRMFMPRLVFGEGLGEFKKVDNEALGIKVMSEEEVKQLVSKYM